MSWKKYLNDGKRLWIVVGYTDTSVSYQKEELADALWQAVKEVLKNDWPTTTSTKEKET